MQEKPINFQQRRVDLAKPDEIIHLKHQSVALTDLIYFSSTKKVFLNRANPGTSERTHQLVCCTDDLIKVYSISDTKGILLEFQFPLKDPVEDRDYSTFVRDPSRVFINRTRVNKVTIITTVTPNYNEQEVNFHEISLRDSTPKGKQIYPLRSVQTNHSSEAHFLLTNANSHRIYIQNCLFKIEFLEVSQTYITSNLKVRRPNILLKIKHSNVKEIYESRVGKLNNKQKQLYSRVMGVRAWDIDTVSDYILGLRHNNNFKTKEINQRLYCIEFNILNFMTLIKVYDKLSKRVLKVISLLPGKILFRALKEKKLYDEKFTYLKDTKVTNYDFLEDKVVIEGKIHRKSMIHNMDGFYDFKLVAHNCTMRKADRKYHLKMMSSTKIKIKKGCLGDFDYFFSRSKDKKDNLEVNYFKKGGSKKAAKKLTLDPREDPLLTRMTKIQELAVLGKENSQIYFRDRRFLYLVDMKSSKVKQRVRYSTFRTLATGTRLLHNTFAKEDSETNMLEFFRVEEGGEVSDLHDLNLKSLITNAVEKSGNKFYTIESIRLSESKNGQISLIGDVEIDRVAPKYIGCMYCVIYIDKDTQKVKSCVAVSREAIHKLPDRTIHSLSYDFQKTHWYCLTYDENKYIHYSLGRPLKKGIVVKTLNLKKGVRRQFRGRIVDRRAYKAGRIYIANTSEDPAVRGTEGSRLTVLVKSEPEKVYCMEGSLMISRYWYNFIDEEEDLKVFAFREGTQEKSPEFVIANRDLVITHKIVVEGYCAGMVSPKARIYRLERLLPANLLFFWQGDEYGYNYLSLSFLLDLTDLSLKRIFVSGNGAGDGEGGEVSTEEMNVKCLKNLKLWSADPGFIMINKWVYYLGGGKSKSK